MRFLTSPNVIQTILLTFVLSSAQDATVGDAGARSECFGLVQKGQFTLAIAKCSKALDEKSDPQVYMQRAEAYLETGSLRLARLDIEKAIDLDPKSLDSIKALVGFYIKTCDFESATEAAQPLTTEKPAQLKLIEQAQTAYRALEKAIAEKNFVKAEKEASNLANGHLSRCEQVHNFKVTALIGQTKYREALTALQQKSTFEADPVKSEFEAAKLYLALGNIKKAQALLDSCARNDQGNSRYLSLRRKILDMFALIGEAETKMLLNPAVETLEYLLEEVNKTKETEPYYDERFPSLFKGFEFPISKVLCAKLTRLKRGKTAIDRCRVAQKLDPTPNESYWMHISESHAHLEEYQEAVNILKEGLRKFPRSTSLTEALQKASKELKKSKRKDHYKILGVSPTATDEEIRRAFNRAARHFHPDKQENSEDKAKAEAKMQELNHSYGILKDPKKRKQFDAGIDVDDPTGGESSGFHGSPFGGGGGGFHFNMKDFEAMFGGFDRGAGRSYGGSRGAGNNKRRQGHEHFFYHEDL